MNVYRDKLRLRHHQCSADCKLKLKSIFDIFQDAAAEHADILGCGMKNMLEHKTLWVISRQKIAINRLPEVGENITVETYPCGMERLFAIREYRIYDGENNLIIQGTAAWLIIDMNTMRPKRLNEELLALVPDNSNMPVSFHALGKLPLCKDDSMFCFSTQVRSSDIDMNRHLNNANYAAMVQDAVYSIEKNVDDITSVEINYLRSGKSGEDINVYLQPQENLASVCGYCGDESAFSAQVTLK